MLHTESMYSPKRFQEELTDCAQRIDQLRTFGVPGQLNGEDLLTALRTTLLAVRKLESLQTELIDKSETTRAARKLGAATSDLVSHTIGVSKKEANGIVLRAVDRAQYPRLEIAYAEGKLGDRAMRLTMKALKWLKKDLPAQTYPEAEQKAVKLGTELVDGPLARALEELVSSYPQSLPRLEREKQEVEQQRGIFFSAIAGGWSLTGLLPETEGNIVRRALGIGARKDRARRINHKLPALPEPARVADALVDLCRRHLPTDDGEGQSAAAAGPVVSGKGVAVDRRTLNKQKVDHGKVDRIEESGAKKETSKRERDEGRSPKTEGNEGGGGVAWHSAVPSGTTTEKTPAPPPGLSGFKEPGSNEDSQNPQTLFAGSGISMPVGQADGSMELGRDARLASLAQRSALLERDGGCIAPKCDALPETCEVHHIKRWGLGGRTNLSNLVLLCPHHHWMADHPQSGLVVPTTGDLEDRPRGRYHTLDKFARETLVTPTVEQVPLQMDGMSQALLRKNNPAMNRTTRRNREGPSEDAQPP